jgi:phage terminase small subunit
MGLTPKQEKFCQGIVSGLSQADAYRDAYNCENMSDEVIWKEASNLMKDRKVSVRIEELRKEITQEIKFTIEDALREFNEAQENLRLQNNWVGFGKITTEKAKLLGLYENDGGVNVSVTMMPTVEIDGKELELDIGDEPNKDTEFVKSAG